MRILAPRYEIFQQFRNSLVCCSRVGTFRDDNMIVLRFPQICPGQTNHIQPRGCQLPQPDTANEVRTRSPVFQEFARSSDLPARGAGEMTTDSVSYPLFILHFSESILNYVSQFTKCQPLQLVASFRTCPIFICCSVVKLTHCQFYRLTPRLIHCQFCTSGVRLTHCQFNCSIPN